MSVLPSGSSFVTNAVVEPAGSGGGACWYALAVGKSNEVVEPVT